MNDNVDYTLMRRRIAKHDTLRAIAPAEICAFCKRFKRQGYECPECAGAKREEQR